MGKALKIVVIVFACLILLAILALVGLSVLMGRLNSHYYEYAQTGGEIEKKLTALGGSSVSYAEFEAKNTSWKKYEVWYPSEMKDSAASYPLVVMANGTGIKASQYPEVFRHLASWGFIVIGNEDENSRTGESSAATLDFILGLNEDKSSDFYGKIDTDNIGIAGHSQGGVGAINAVTKQENGTLYKAVWAASTTSRYHAKELNRSGGGWDCDLSGMNVPCFMVAGTKDFDAGNVLEYTPEKPAEGRAQGICPLWWLNECYDAIPDSVDKGIARQAGKDHGDMLRSADGYMTAWFLYYLQGNEGAGNAFFGENAEILSNPMWQDIQISR